MPTIAIIDDDREVRAAIRNLIQSQGLRARSFASARQFLRVLAKEEIDCVITDIQMPGMNGAALQHTLLQRGCTLPMIFITAFPDEALQRRLEADGAVCVLSKPFDPGQLISLLNEGLGLGD